MTDINQIIKMGEGPNQLFLFGCDELKTPQDIVALANSGGGNIVFGVKPSGKIVGVDPEHTIIQLNRLIETHCSTGLSFTFEKFVENLRPVLLMSVMSSETHSMMARTQDQKMKRFMRIENNSVPVSKILESLWELENRDAPKIEEVTHEGELILDYLETNPDSTLSNMYKHLPIEMTDIDKWLPILIYNNRVIFKLNPAAISYSIKY